MSEHLTEFYINGHWVKPHSKSTFCVIDPSTETEIARIIMGDETDCDHAVDAAKAAFPAFSETSAAERVAILKRIITAYDRRMDDIAGAISAEMGAPAQMARDSQAWSGLAHLRATLQALEGFAFEQTRGSTRIRYEPIGVVGLITPWNWPMNQIACKVAPAIAAGCTMVLKPSELAPLSAILMAEIMDEARVPPGVFNLLHGDGPSVGQRLASHPDIDMVSFTGSTRAGVLVAKAAADTVKRVAQELGGKSANIILPDADFTHAVTEGVKACFFNSGQSCDAPTRMLTPVARHEEALAIARAVADSLIVGDPKAKGVDLGPVISARQFDKIQELIAIGLNEGATLVAGGIGRPAHLDRGYFVRPTVFGHVTPTMTIAREEIFGPVLAIMPYESEDQAVAIANDSPFGLAGYVQSGNIDHARTIARRLRAGQIHLNYPDWDLFAPFGGYKQSGNGREYAAWGLHDFLEVKAIIGYGADEAATSGHT